MTSSEKKTTIVPGNVPAGERGPDFFISYANEDATWAEWMAWVLEEAGYSVMLQAWDFRPGSNFVVEMQKAASQARRTLAVLSTGYLVSGFGTAEWAAAFVQDPTGEKGLLVPVMVEKCEAPGLLGAVISIDLVGRSEPEAAKQLLEGLRTGRLKPARKPGFPAKERAARPQAPFPGQTGLPGVWNVPSRNRSFSGREEELACLEKALKSGNHKALVQAVSALGGVGKTELAREYAYRHAGEYGIVWWLHAETVPTLSEDFASLWRALSVAAQAPAAEIGFAVAGQRPDLREMVTAVHGIMRGRSDWLLVFDNAPDPEAIRDFLPSPVTGHVIITSRNPNWGGTATALDLAPFKREESLGFLKQRTGRDEPEAARELAEALGDLPLALEQAAAYTVHTGISLEDYLALFKTNRKELWGVAPAPGDYKKTVSTTWQVSIAEAERRAPGATDLLHLVAYLAPDDIPRSLLAEHVEGIPSSLLALSSDPVRVNSVVAALGGFSLVRATPDALSLHRLVQQVVRDDLTELERRAWVTAAVKVVSQGFPFDQDTPVTWSVSFRLVPHVLAAAEQAEAEGIREEPLGALLNLTGQCLRTQGQFLAARQVLERALWIAEKAHGTNHPNVAACLCNLGSVLQDLGDLPGAQKAFERALSIAEKAHGTDHVNVAACLCNLSSVLQDLGDLPGAKKAIERALWIAEKAHGPDHPTVAALVNNLGGVLQDLGDLPGAKRAYERALSIDEKVHGLSHPGVAAAMNNLGSLLKELGDLPGAKKAIERALSIDEKVYSPNHPTVARDVNNLGTVLKGLGELPEAKKAIERALSIDEKVYGAGHPAVARDVSNLGSVLQDLGDLPGAKKAIERALTIVEKVYGADHPTVAICVTNLGGVLQALGDLPGAKKAIERALSINEKVFGPDHPAVAGDVSNLGGVLQALGDLPGAKKAIERALSINEKVYGPDHPAVAICVSNLSLVLKALGDLSGAGKAHRRAEMIRRHLPAS